MAHSMINLKMIGTVVKYNSSIFVDPHSHPNGLYCVHQCSWTLTPANSI